MKNRFAKVLLPVFLFSGAAMADGVVYPTQSLLGVEVGVANINYDISNKRDTINKTVENLGVKIGAQSHNYRVFLSMNYYTKPDSSYDYIGTYGGELDYLLNISSKTNLYLGVNTGIANMKFRAPHELTKRTISNPYYGVDAGITIHRSRLIDLEFGARFMMLDATNRKNNITYRFNSFMNAYASINFKYQMDD
ncbi:hypothetical protein MNB_SM-5-1119 [hydrothermal vent metagenome]|uniref:Outer membrane protein beta-barrel domain-containing protein n=1 Tax=hydrothermal vent metagenome TaxID=652676 RepID=A0A1W1CZ40_9ZZZZ